MIVKGEDEVPDSKSGDEEQIEKQLCLLRCGERAG